MYNKALRLTDTSCRQVSSDVGEQMNKKYKIALIVVGVLLILNGVANIVDDSRILTYDITSLLAGIGFILVATVTAY